MANNLQIVSFYIEEQFFGMDIRVVKEINPTTNICLVPRTPAHLRGLVNIRGQVVLVMDIAVMFGRAPRPITENSQIVILKTASEIQNAKNLEAEDAYSLFGDKPLGVLVDKIGDVIEVPAKELEPVPRHIEEAKTRFFSGVVNLEEDLLMLLKASEILSFGETVDVN